MKKFIGFTIVIFAICLITSSCGSGGPDPVENGVTCELSEECVSGNCVTEFQDETEVAGGFCTDECAWLTTDGEECEAGLDCLVDSCPDTELCLRYNPTGEKVCFQKCTANEDCRVNEGWECVCLDFFCDAQACVPPL